MIIKSATFVISNSDYRKCPSDGLPEYAFIGRSNVGKSSLINMLTGVKGLAKTSSRPGKTQLINHFLINKQWYLVDLPGYGYAQTSKSSRQHWQKMTEQYMLHREALTNVYVLVDSRIEPRPIDLEFINFLGANGIPLSIVFTKTDGEKQREVSANINRFKSALLQQWEELPDIMLTSSSTGYGRDALLNHIESINSAVSG
ncbi:MAG: YihA family ribosome biogenesis GTP-binding protein [Bacteroidales bacterium]|nr:YihA family ribosome biogenesis GTP-binding protein [Bacteroidales bacterium]